jgi:hypothetical protein
VVPATWEAEVAGWRARQKQEMLPEKEIVIKRNGYVVESKALSSVFITDKKKKKRKEKEKDK